MEQRITRALFRIAHVANRIENAILVALVAVLVAIAGAQIVLRNLFGGGLVWADPLMRTLVLWVGLVGAVVAAQHDNHIAINVLARLLPPGLKRWTRVLTDLTTAAVCAALAWTGGALIISEYEGGALAFGRVPVWACQLVIPLAFGGIALRYLGLAWINGMRARRTPSSPES